MTLRYTLEEREAMAVVRKAKARARLPAERTKIVLPPRPSVTPAQKAKAHMAYQGQCYVCGADLPVTGPEVAYDHITPRMDHGSDAIDNLAPICRVPCHAEKTAAELSRRAKAERCRGKHEGSIKPKGSIRSAGFPNVKQRFR